MPDSAARFILVRHGETEANRFSRFAESTEIELTATGIAQAEALASLLAEQYRPNRVISSEFRRARQTADILGARLRLPVDAFPGLHERDFGCLKGKAYHEMGILMRSDARYDPERRWLWEPPGGESLAAVQQRVLRALRQLHGIYPRDGVVIVSHGAVMEAVAAHLAGNWTGAAVPPNCATLLLDPAAL